MSEVADRRAEGEAGRDAGREPSPLDLLGSRRALVDTGLGPLAFVVANAVAGLHTAVAVAVGVSVVLCVERLVRRAPVVNAIGGLLGTGLAAFIALRTGKAETYFVPRAIYQAVLAVAFAGSVAVRRPLIAYVVATLYRAREGWAADPRVRRAFSEVTLAWAGLFAFRAAVYAVLIAAGRTGWLGAASIVMGWPAFLALLWLSWPYGRRRLAQLGAPEPR
jgi:Protein of unknown function (DUF3159)